MMIPHKVKITINASGYGDVFLDGVRLKNVKGGIIKFSASELTEVTFTIIADIETDAQFDKNLKLSETV